MTRRSQSDTGSGVLSTFLGSTVFLAFLLFAAHLLLGLYAESVVGAVAYDAAKTVAGADAGGDPAAAAASARASLGRLGSDASFDWDVSDEAVRLTVRVARPAILPGWLARVRGPIERTVRVRTERVR